MGGRCVPLLASDSLAMLVVNFSLIWHLFHMNHGFSLQSRLLCSIHQFSSFIFLIRVCLPSTKRKGDEAVFLICFWSGELA